MTKTEVEHAVAAATGEPLREIRRRGFNLLVPLVVDFDHEPCEHLPATVDWDEIQGRWTALFP